MRALSFGEDYVISRFNHSVRGDYHTEALIFKMVTVRFFYVFEDETNKMKENVVGLITTWL